MGMVGVKGKGGRGHLSHNAAVPTWPIVFGPGPAQATHPFANRHRNPLANRQRYPHCQPTTLSISPTDTVIHIANRQRYPYRQPTTLSISPRTAREQAGEPLVAHKPYAAAWSAPACKHHAHGRGVCGGDSQREEQAALEDPPRAHAACLAAQCRRACARHRACAAVHAVRRRDQERHGDTHSRAPRRHGIVRQHETRYVLCNFQREATCIEHGMPRAVQRRARRRGPCRRRGLSNEPITAPVKPRL
jgi:hypothetical protein